VLSPFRFRDDAPYAIEKASALPTADTFRTECFGDAGWSGNHAGADGRNDGPEHPVLAEP